MGNVDGSATAVEPLGTGTSIAGESPAGAVRPGSVLAGKYELQRVLGRGAMGEVWEATHLDLEGRVAIKLLRPAAVSARGVERFRREAKLVARLRTEHVCRVRDFGTLDDGSPFLVMDHLEGADLARILRQRGPLPVIEAVDLVLQVCHALTEAHALGVVHRDLKPSNLFLTTMPDGSSLVKVLDFGISKAPDADSAPLRLTSATAVLGSPYYMSPEQIEDARRVDARADVWALGAVLHELLAGRRPFEGASEEDLFDRILADDPVRVCDVRTDVPEALAAVVQACLTKDVQARVSGMPELAERLSPFASARGRLLAELVRGAPTSPRGPSPVELSPIRHGETRADSEAPSAASARETASSDEEGETAGRDDAPRPRLLGGRYAPRRVLGRGAMGVVYEATDPDGKEVAIKVIDPEHAGADDLRRRLLAEARAASRLSSPHVVKILHVDTEDTGAPFIVMELLRGSDLERTLRALGPLEPTAAVRMFLQACEGLAAAHDTSLVHRDIKPANLFLHTGPNGDVVVKICDFGIVKSTETVVEDPTDHRLTKTGFFLGSPLYMSPEQATDPSGVDRRTDIWSICISMYEALCGVNPWMKCKTPGQLIVALWTKDVPPLREAAPWVEPALAAVIHRGLRRDPADRWGSAAALRNALLPFAGGGARLHGAMIVSAPPSKEANGAQDAERAAAPAGLPALPTAAPLAGRRAISVVGAAALVVAGGLWAVSRDPLSPAAPAEEATSPVMDTAEARPPATPSPVTPSSAASPAPSTVPEPVPSSSAVVPPGRPPPVPRPSSPVAAPRPSGMVSVAPAPAAAPSTGASTSGPNEPRVQMQPWSDVP